MVHIADGTPHLKVKLGDTFSEMPMPVFDEPEAQINPICKLYDQLFEIYGEQHWWACKRGKRWEIITGAVLTQNCAWTNVKKALDNLESAKAMSPEAILQMPSEILQEAIRPAGFFKQKSVYLKAAAAFFMEHEQKIIQSTDVWSLRKQLLTLKGIGRETAVSILLYAFQKPIFVINAYTRRVTERYLHLDAPMPYNELQKIFNVGFFLRSRFLKKYTMYACFLFCCGLY